MSGNEPENLMNGLFNEMNRCRELLQMYKEIGPAGVFGAHFIKADIDFAETAIKEMDVVKMVQAYAALKECK